MATVTATTRPWKVGDSAITLTQAGTADSDGTMQPQGKIVLSSPQIHAIAAVTVKGTPGENVGFYRFGFIQLKFITDDWAHYRGRAKTDGSTFFALDRPPARPQQLCRDTYSVGPGSGDVPIVGPIMFYDGDQSIHLAAPIVFRKAGFFPGGTAIPASGSIALTVEFWDSPDRDFELLKSNTQFAPPRLNYLYSLQTGAAYATMFVVQKGLGAPIEVLLNFQWNVRWRAHFGIDLVGHVVQLPKRKHDVTDMNVSGVFSGAPTNPLFKNLVTDIGLPVCNAVLHAAYDNPFLRMSPKWEDWDVRH